MRNIVKKSLAMVIACLIATPIFAEKIYVITSTCNIPLTAGMNKASYQLFTWDGTTQEATNAISCDVNTTAGFYYNSNSLAYTDLTNTSNYSTGSSSNRTLRGIKLIKNATMTITLNSVAVKKIAVIGRCASSDECTIDIAGETVTTKSNSEFFLKEIEPASPFTNKIVIVNTSVKQKEYNLFVYLVEGEAGPSTDATLKTLTYDGTSVPNFSATKLTYDIELPAGTTQVPVVAATANDSKATVSVTQADKLPGTATVTVTAEKTDVKQEYKVNFTIADGIPVVLNAWWQDISGTPAITHPEGTTNGTIQGKVTYGASLTLTPTFTGKNIKSWTPDGAQDFSKGPVTYIISGEGPIAYYDLTIESEPFVNVTGVTLDQTELALKEGTDATLHATITPENATNKNLTWESNNTAVATVANGVVTAAGEGEATITVTTADGAKSASCKVTVTAGTPVPTTDLSIHQPEVYEADRAAGGYGGTLTVKNGAEYEVYYFCKISSAIAVGTEPISGNIATSSEKKSFTVEGNWMKGTFNEEAEGGTSEPKEDAPGADEFKACYGDVKMGESAEVTFHIQGYDEFAIYAADNNTSLNNNKKRWIDVYIDDMTTPVTTGVAQKPATVRRYSISTKEHVIKLTSEYSGSKLYAISLRVPKEPRVKYLDGNDTTQSVLQTTNIKPITYATKYNNIQGAETRLVWDGKEASGISLTKIAGELSDTLVLEGKANCPVGEYKYRIAAYYNGAETNGLSGTFRVSSSIVAKSDTSIHAYTNETMDQIIFTYYAISEEDVLLTWPNGKPEGIDGTGKDGRYIISGTPTATGTFPYTITTTDGETVITGRIVVDNLTYTDKSVLYIYKNNMAYEHDAVYQYLSGAWDFIVRKQKEDGLRPVDQYANYKWVLISEDADANNEEVLSLIQGYNNHFVNIPVFNLKSFTYSTDRLGWGRPNNGSIDTLTEGATKLYVQREDHTIFRSLNKKHGDSITIVEMEKGKQGVMPVEIQQDDFSYSLATAHTRDINDYYKDGELQTVLHEMPAELREGNKYICLGLSRQVTLTADGKKVLDAIVKYLTAEKAETLTEPELQITRFAVNGIAGEIDEYEKTITVRVDTLANPGWDYSALQTEIELKDPVYTYVKPADGSEVNYLYAANTPVRFIVSDYVRREVYNVKVKRFMPQGIEEVYEAGQWVNIYDIYGRKVTTTNEDIYTMELPRGMYIVVTEAGQTLKIMR